MTAAGHVLLVSSWWLDWTHLSVSTKPWCVGLRCRGPHSALPLRTASFPVVARGLSLRSRLAPLCTC